MPLLGEQITTQGPDVHLSEEDVKGRVFAVVDGNHRLAAMKSATAVESKNAPSRVRCAILKNANLQELLASGFLINFIRGVQATDTFYDRIVWVQQHRK